ncbi:MAG: hypothetical protein ACAI44_09585, partial [Candidatus Sericytochromatia bacterium]
MGDLPINPKVFQAFKQAIKSDGMTKDELQDIKTAILSDGEYDASEKKLVEELESRSSGSLGLIADDGNRLEFNPAKVLSKKLAKTLDGWDKVSDAWTTAFESKLVDGSLSPEDLAALRKAAKNPKDLELLAQLADTHPSASVSIKVNGFPYDLDRKGDSWQLNQEQVGLEIDFMAEKARQEAPGSATRKLLVSLLDHANPLIRASALTVLNQRIDRDWELMDDLKAGHLKAKQPEAFAKLEQTRLQSIKQSFQVWQQDLPGKLANLTGTFYQDPAQEAWLLAKGLVFYEKTTDTPLDPKLRDQLKSQLQAAAKAELAKPDLPAASRIYWLHAEFTLDPKGTAAELEKFLLNAPEPSDSKAELSYMSALNALLKFSPRAGDIAVKVIEAQGKSSRWVKESALEYLKAHQPKLDPATYEKMLASDLESARLNALDKLAEIATPATVKLILAHYQRPNISAVEVSRAESLL